MSIYSQQFIHAVKAATAPEFHHTYLSMYDHFYIICPCLLHITIAQLRSQSFPLLCIKVAQMLV